jgi:hypothetical protein
VTHPHHKRYFFPCEWCSKLFKRADLKTPAGLLTGLACPGCREKIKAEPRKDGKTIATFRLGRMP